jgi:hypothetical protein
MYDRISYSTCTCTGMYKALASDETRQDKTRRDERDEMRQDECRLVSS